MRGGGPGALRAGLRRGHHRVEAHVDPEDEAAQRIATFAGLHARGRRPRACADGTDRVVYARLADDTPVEEPMGFRALLNSFLPRKRAISQLLMRDDARAGCCCAS